MSLFKKNRTAADTGNGGSGEENGGMISAGVTAGESVGKTGEVTVKKSSMNAATEYDYRFLVYENDLLLPAEICPDGEVLHITYRIGERSPFEEATSEDLPERLQLLISCAALAGLGREYCFSLEPGNLYYDAQYRTAVRARDIYAVGAEASEEEFCRQYRALIGFLLQKKYSYRDYLQGGQQLLSESRFLSGLLNLHTAEEIRRYLEAEYLRIKKDRSENYELFPKKAHRALKITAVSLAVLLAAAAGFLVYHMFFVEPYKDAEIGLSRAYTKSDYETSIRAMEKVPVKKMSDVEKYMLATAYVRTEDLTSEQKENIIETFSLNNAPERMEYWIYAGRNQTEEAVDIGIRLSDGQLQLYAYMKAKAMTEADTSMDAEKKKETLDKLDQKIEELSKEYSLDEEDK